MGEKNWMELMQLNPQCQAVAKCNEYTKEYGLVLSDEEARELVESKNETLKMEHRVEFGETILPQLIVTFCDSGFIDQEHYKETLVRLQDIFYEFKNEMMDETTDEEVLNFMRQQYDEVCFGDLDYLEGTCMDLFAQAIRAGYRGYHVTDGKDEFSKVDLVTRWDRELYMEALEHLF